MLKVALIYPELLGTYGDGGNALVLVERARRRGIEAELISVSLTDHVPDASIYVLGGGEDGPQRQATEALRNDGSLAARIDDGSFVFAVCAGLQILGESFAVGDGSDVEGLGLVDVRTSRGAQRRVGEMKLLIGGKQLVGFENHGGVTSLGQTEPLGTMVSGFGNDGVVDGFRAKGMAATYAHGPVLALNPWFADELLEGSLGESLPQLSTPADRLYEERCRSVN